MTSEYGMGKIPADWQGSGFNMPDALLQHFLTCPVVDGQPDADFRDLNIPHHTVYIQAIKIITRQSIARAGDKRVAYRISGEIIVILLRFLPLRLIKALILCCKFLFIFLNHAGLVNFCQPVANSRIQKHRRTSQKKQDGKSYGSQTKPTSFLFISSFLPHPKRYLSSEQLKGRGSKAPPVFLQHRLN